MKPAPGVALRIAATQTLGVVLQRQRSLKAELAQRLPTLRDVRDRALLEAIVFTAIRGSPSRSGIATKTCARCSTSASRRSRWACRRMRRST